MLPIQKSQFIAQCKTYIRLNEQLTRMMPNYCDYDLNFNGYDSTHLRYLNQHIRANHDTSMQELHDQIDAIYLTCNSENIEEAHQVFPPTELMPFEEWYAELPEIAAPSADYTETMCSLDVQVAVLEDMTEEVPEPLSMPLPVDVISEILNFPNFSNSPLLSEEISEEWNLETMFAYVSDGSDSTESLIIDTDYESDKERGKQ